MPRDGSSNRVTMKEDGKFMAVIFLAISFLIGVVIWSVNISNHERAIKDPRQGTVELQYGSKFCDGTTLVYEGLGTSAIPNSQECQK